MDLTVEQLADLKISLQKYKMLLENTKKEFKSLDNVNKNLESTNNRLKEEIDTQVEIKENLIMENEKLRVEKVGILSKFSEDNEKLYTELRKKEDEISGKEKQIALRLIEIEKREQKIVNSQNTNNILLSEIKNAKKENKEETIRCEEILIKTEESRKKLEVQEQTIKNEISKLRQVQKETNGRNIKIQEKELFLSEKVQENSVLLSEINHKESVLKADSERLERLNTLFIELKKYVTEKGNLTIDQIDAFLKGKTNEQLEIPENAIIEDEIEKPEIEKPEIKQINVEEELDIQNMKYSELQAEAKKRNIDLPKNTKKEDLIKLLSK